MPHQIKIATCSYCGNRQTLRLSARDGHELACGSCGAPLHEMKWLRPPDPEKKAKRSPRHAAPHGNPLPQDRKAQARASTPDWAGQGRDWRGDDDARHEKDRRRKKKKRRKATWKRAMEEVFDVIEDIFD